jgi:hypothetical protein
MSTDGKTLKAEDRNIRRKHCVCSSLATTNLIWTVQGFNPGLGRERPEPLHGLKIIRINNAKVLLLSFLDELIRYLDKR